MLGDLLSGLKPLGHVVGSPETQRKGQCSNAWQKSAGQTGSRVESCWSQLTAATLGFRRSYQDIRTRLELVTGHSSG